MIFTRLDLVYYLIPCLAVVLAVRRLREKHFLAHSRLPQFQSSFMRAGGFIHLPYYLRWSALVLLALAVLNPVLSFAEQQIQFRGLDIVLVIDLSASMSQALPATAAEAEKLDQMDPFFAPRGAQPSRMDAVKVAVKSFIRSRKSDRIGLVIFSTNAYVVCPMTLDYDYLTQYIDMMDHRTLVGEGMTAIGEGIHAGVKLLLKQNQDRKGRSGDKLLIVLTDGENNMGRSPVNAVEYTKEKDVKVYLIGVDVPVTPITQRLMAAISLAGGKYYDVRNQEQLNQAYGEIGAMEKSDFAVKEYNRSLPFYHQVTLGSMICLLLALSLKGLTYFTELS